MEACELPKKTDFPNAVSRNDDCQDSETNELPGKRITPTRLEPCKRERVRKAFYNKRVSGIQQTANSGAGFMVAEFPRGSYGNRGCGLV
jgi:hypothetical protein